MTLGRKILRIRQILERGCCNQSLHSRGRTSRSGSHKRLLDSHGFGPKSLGKDFSHMGDAALLALYHCSSLCLCRSGSTQSDGRRKEEQENRVTSFLSSCSFTLSCPSDDLPQYSWGSCARYVQIRKGMLNYFITCFLFGSLRKHRALNPALNFLY